MNHSFRLQKNTDSVDIENNCIGVSAWVVGDSTSKLNTNRGLHIQIRHNKNKDQFEVASQLSNLISVAPEMFEELEYCLKYFKCSNDVVSEDYIKAIEKVLKKAKGE